MSLMYTEAYTFVRLITKLFSPARRPLVGSNLLTIHIHHGSFNSPASVSFLDGAFSMEAYNILESTKSYVGGAH